MKKYHEHNKNSFKHFTSGFQNPNCVSRSIAVSNCFIGATSFVLHIPNVVRVDLVNKICRLCQVYHLVRID